MANVVPGPTADADALLATCRAAWERFNLVGSDGLEGDGTGDHLFGEPAWETLPTGEDAIMLGFDPFEAQAPDPHRAHACLQILLEALAEAGHDVAVRNAMDVPDDAGLDFHSLADGADQIPVDLPQEPAEPKRPSFLGPPHTVKRVSKGLPKGPVALAQFADKYRVYDPATGQLIALPLLDYEGGWGPASTGHQLTPDGLAFDYLVTSYPDDYRPATVEPFVGGERRRAIHYVDRFDHGPLSPWLSKDADTYLQSSTGSQILVIHHERDPRTWEYLYAEGVVAEPGSQRTLTPPPGFVNVSWSRTGRYLLGTSLVEKGMHPTPQQLANHEAGIGDSVVRYDLSNDTYITYQRLHNNLNVTGSAPFAPDETRCLVHSWGAPGRHALPMRYGILTFETDELTPIDDGLDSGMPLGFLTDTGLVVQHEKGRRAILTYLDLETSTQHLLLDLPHPGRGLGREPIALAARVIQNDPTTLGAPVDPAVRSRARTGPTSR